MPKKKPVNPFYVVLVLAGVAFGLTALGYFVMAAMATYDPIGSRESMDRDGGLLAVMDRFGVQMMVIELIILATATILAIGTDRVWARVAESRHATSAGSNEDDSKKEE